MENVINKMPGCFDRMSYIGQLSKKLLPPGVISKDLAYSANVKDLINGDFSLLIFTKWINDTENTRSWYKSKLVGKSVIKKIYYNELNGHILRQEPTKEGEKYRMLVLEIRQKLVELYLANVGEVDFEVNLTELAAIITDKPETLRVEFGKLEAAGKRTSSDRPVYNFLENTRRILDRVNENISLMDVVGLEQNLGEVSKFAKSHDLLKSKTCRGKDNKLYYENVRGHADDLNGKKSK